MVPQLDWQLRSFKAMPGMPGEERSFEGRVMRFPPKPAQPRRDSYFAIAETADWDAVAESLTAYWLKVCEVLPKYYAGKNTPDPLAGEPPETVAVDNGWNRIVCILDVINGKITTNLWKGATSPRHCDRVWVIMRVPMIERLFNARPEGKMGPEAEELERQMHKALANAAASEPARVALRETGPVAQVHALGDQRHAR